MLGPDSRFIHQGMTSSDVIDTCLNIQLKQAGNILISGLDKLINALEKKKQSNIKILFVWEEVMEFMLSQQLLV